MGILEILMVIFVLEAGIALVVAVRRNGQRGNNVEEILRKFEDRLRKRIERAEQDNNGHYRTSVTSPEFDAGAAAMKQANDFVRQIEKTYGGN